MISPAKKLDHRSIIGQQGVNLIERVVLAMEWVWHPTGSLETGIDGIIEIRDPSTGQTTNSIIQVQSKATKNPFLAETNDGFQFLCEERDLDYWLRGNAPVILVVSRPDKNEAYWISIKNYFNSPEKIREKKVHFDKKRDRFDEGCRHSLVTLALPRNAGIYFSPLPKNEILYSNLLEVVFPAEHIFVAETEFRDPKFVWLELKKITEEPSGAWFLKSKQILSFYNLADPPFDKVCQIETVSKSKTNEWAYSSDIGKRRDFVQLLNRCLREISRNLDLNYSKSEEAFYFRPTSDMSPRELTYRSITKITKREVFRGYPSRRDPTKMAYYRHSAFEGSFVLIDNCWYLQITPTYVFTRDGFYPSKYRQDNLKLIKQKERNPAVLGQVIMWADYLRTRGDLLVPKYPFLHFNDLTKFDIDFGVDDNSWLPHEEEEEKEELRKDQLELFD